MPYSLMRRLSQQSATYLFLALFLLVAAGFIHQWDYAFQNWLQPYRSYQLAGTWHGDLMRVIRPLGKGNVIVVLALFIGACGLKRRAIEILTALVIVGIVVFPTKKIVGRARPSGANHDSFPSGDTAGFTAAVVPLAAQSTVMLPVAGLLITAVAVMRVLDNNHYLSDVLAGMALGLIAAAAAMALRLDRWWPFSKLRYHHLALLSVSLSMIWYIPGLIRGKGTFFDFSMMFGPIMVHRQCLVYLPFRFKWPRDKTPVQRDRFSWLRKVLIPSCEKADLMRCMPSGSNQYRAVVIITLTSLAVLVIYLWCLQLQHLKLPLAGIFLMVAFSTATIYKLTQMGREQYAACTMVSGIVLLFLFFLLHILPVAVH